VADNNTAADDMLMPLPLQRRHLPPLQPQLHHRD